MKLVLANLNKMQWSKGTEDVRQLTGTKEREFRGQRSSTVWEAQLQMASLRSPSRLHQGQSLSILPYCDSETPGMSPQAGHLTNVPATAKEEKG